MTGLRAFLSAAAATAVMFAGPTTAGAAEFGEDTSFSMEVPYLQGDLAAEQPVPVGHRVRIVPPPAYYPPQDYTQSYGQYPDQQGAYAQEPLPPRPNGRCLQPSQIQNMLAAQGWQGFVNPQRGVDVVGLTARRPNGLTYRLKLDRCTGVIIQANLLDQPDTRRNYTYNPDAPPPGY